MTRLQEFLEADDGRLSIRSLTVLMSMSVASAVVLWMAMQDTLTEGIFGSYLLAGGGIYSFGKWSDSSVRKSQIESQHRHQGRFDSRPKANVTVEKS